MTIFDSFMIWFHLDCIVQLNKSYYIATNVCSRKSATILVISLTDIVHTVQVIPTNFYVMPCLKTRSDSASSLRHKWLHLPNNDYLAYTYFDGYFAEPPFQSEFA